MQLTAVLLLLSLGSWLVGGQQDQQIEIDEETRKRIDEVFSTGGNNEFLPGYEEVVSSNNDSYGALENCGEGSTKNVKRCVNYSMCDGKTNTIVQQGVTDGFGTIDIRFGANACSHYMDVCCKIPEGGLDPNLPLPGDDDNLEPRLPDDTSQGTSQNPITPDIVTPEPVTTPPIVKPSFCGIRNPDGIDFKITGNRNHEAEYGEFPWMVAILNKNYLVQGLQKPLICGGSLITPNVVLTGAHCVHNSKTFDLVIRAGEWDTQTTKERLPYQERNVKTIIVHEDFIYGNLFNDVALLILDESIRKADNVGTICLPSQATRINSRNCFVSGWGKDEFGKQGKFQAILKKIELPTIERRRCQDALRTTRLGQSFALHSSFMCAGGEKGKDACTGDGGSPLVCPDPQNPERYVQAGIVAWGIGCGELNIPGVYADVSKFRSWVDQKLRRLNIGDAPYTV